MVMVVPPSTLPLSGNTLSISGRYKEREREREREGEKGKVQANSLFRTITGEVKQCEQGLIST